MSQSKVQLPSHRLVLLQSVLPMVEELAQRVISKRELVDEVHAQLGGFRFERIDIVRMFDEFQHEGIFQSIVDEKHVRLFAIRQGIKYLQPIVADMGGSDPVRYFIAAPFIERANGRLTQLLDLESNRSYGGWAA